jgi:hypothetical protein
VENLEPLPPLTVGYDLQCGCSIYHGIRTVNGTYKMWRHTLEWMVQYVRTCILNDP